ncbi:uncharacterized protein LOC135212519 [Macrobrachium nipponense]|uniref:uncharacterized protein LOC135212519 n=1 Tax=Macrobrachium nipponense TaxID=159736 RepID=UPI0030C7A61E
MTVHNASQHTLAYLEETWSPQDINPEMTWVGPGDDSPHKHSLRVNTIIDITFGNQQCNSGSSPCYFLHYEGESPSEICTKAKLDEKTPTNFLECDATLTVDNSPDIASVQEILLTHKIGGSESLEIGATYASNSKEMEIQIYDGNDLKINSFGRCDINITACTVTDIEWPSQEPLYILMTALGEDKHVIESNELQFVDYSTEGQLLTESIVEIRWSSRENITFDVKLQEQDTKVTTVSLTCGDMDNAKCKAYFLELTDQKTYTASVTHKSDTSVSYTVATEIEKTTPDIATLTITKFTELGSGDYTVALSSSISTIIDVGTIYLAIIDSKETAKLKETIIQSVTAGGQLSDAERNFNFTIDRSLLAHRENLSLVITAHGSEDDDNALGVAKVDTQFEDIIPPTINEVGTNSSLWIRARTDELDLTVNGRECPANSTTYFPMEDDFKEPLNLCRKAGTNLNSTEMEQCKIDGTIIHLQDTIPLQYMELLYPATDDKPSMTITVDFQGEADTMEEVIYYDDTNHSPGKCQLINGDSEGLRNCTFLDVTTQPNSNILLVVLNEETVAASTMVPFEDYGTDAMGILADMIQASWSAHDKTTYDCYLDKEVPGSFNMLHVTCGADEVSKCLAFFPDLDHTSYTVRVKKHQNGDLNVVGKVVNMPTTP